MTKYPIPQRLAIAAGLAASAAALGILLSDGFKSGIWTIEHALMPITVGITIASGHLIASAIRDRRLLSAIGFAVLFAAGTLLTVYNSVGRQTEGAETKMAETEAHNTTITDKQADLAKARLRKEQAEAMADTERGTNCGRKCQDWTLRAREVTANIEKIEGQIAALGSVKPVSAKASKIAEVAAIFGADKEKVRQAAILLEPFAWSLFLELTAIVAFGFGFAHRKVAPVAANDTKPMQTPPKGKRKRGRSKDQKVASFVAEYRRKHGRDPGIKDVQASFPALSRTTAYRYAQEYAA